MSANPSDRLEEGFAMAWSGNSARTSPDVED